MNFLKYVVNMYSYVDFFWSANFSHLTEFFSSDETEVDVVEANKVVEVEQVDLDAVVQTIEDVHGKIYITYMHST